MTERVATTPGLYPLPDTAKERLADLKGHQKGDLVSGDEGEDVRSAYEGARADVIDEQVAAGLDRVVEGQLRWDDMLAHPLAVHDNVETGGIVRYYNNNNFYRDPRVVGRLTPSGDVAAELDAAADVLGGGAPLQAILPGPYSLASLATDEHYGDEGAFLDAVASFLAGEVEAFPDHETLFLLEPSLTVDPPAETAERASRAIDAVAAATDADVVVHTYWGALDERTYVHLMDAAVEALGFDLVAGDREATLYNVTEYGTTDAVALGVVDGQNTRMESPTTVAERLDWFERSVPVGEFDRLYATSNTPTFYLPTNRHREKLSALAEGVSIETRTEA